MPKLTFLGHSAFLIEGAEGTVAVDPFLSGNPMAARKAEDISPQTILLTHAHNDHVGDTVDIARRAGAKVIATAELAEWLASEGVEDAIGANHGGTVMFDGGTAKFVPAWHTSSYFDGEKRVAPGVPAGFVVRMDGATIYFAGDTCLFGDMRLIGDEGLDVAVIPIGDHFTMGPDDAVKAVDFLRPGLVIPCHYNSFPVIRQDGAAFAAAVQAKTEARCNPLKPGESVDL